MAREHRVAAFVSRGSYCIVVTSLTLESYAAQRARWPASGRVILAQYDDAHVVVYQAFHRVTADYAVEHQRLGGPRYSLTRMSWIKPNFLWMMYRCGWLTKDADQGRVLAIWIARGFFEEVVRSAVPSSWDRERYESREAWQADVKSSEVRLQWDPDHDPMGQKVERRAIQLGLRGSMLRRFVEDSTHRIEDIGPLVILERSHRADHTALMLPREDPYTLTS